MKKNIKNSNEKARRYVNILGINVISTTLPRLLMGIRDKLTHNSKFYIVTPNPELVLMAQKDNTLKKALNSADFSIPDGTGLVMAYKYLSLPAPRNFLFRVLVVFFQGLYIGISVLINKKWLTTDVETIKGRELFLKLMKLADENSWRVFFLGGENTEAALAARKISLKYKKIKIQSTAGPMFNNDGEPRSEADRKAYLEIVKKINNFKPQLLMICLSDPKEEKWVYKNHDKLNIGGAAAFGGTFRYIAGMSKLPPKWMEKAGLEWAYRLITEPYRWRRILNAFPIFPLRVFWFKVSGR